MSLDASGKNSSYEGQSISGDSRVHLGDVYNHYNSPVPARLVPTSIVPFEPDPKYIERGNILETLSSLCSSQSRKVALVGLGGVGKSQIAIEYAHRARKADESLWVFWIHSATASRFRESLHIIADVLQLPTRQERKHVPWHVKRWFESQTNSRWLLIIDSADDKDVLLSRHSPEQAHQSEAEMIDGLAPLLEYIPKAGNGATLITTRNMSVARCFVDDDRIVHVGAMDTETASRLAETKLRHKHDRTDIASLVNELEGMPLAITQAAAFINRRGLHTSIALYVTQLRKHEDRLASVLAKDLGDLRRDARDSSSSNSVIKTWRISFEQIKREKRLASDLLSMMSMFDRESIPDRFLKKPWEDTEVISPGSDSSIDAELEDGFELLKDYCFISIRVNEGTPRTQSQTFSMHRLVQLATRNWLTAQDELSYWRARYTILLNRLYSSASRNSLARYEMLLPHAVNLLNHSPQDKIVLTARAQVLSRAARFAYETGRYEICAKMSAEAFESQAELHGSRHPSALSSLHQLAIAQSQQGKLLEAAKVISQSRRISAEVRGASHPETLACMHDEAVILRIVGNFKAAEEVATATLSERRKVLGNNHTDTLSTLNILSTIKQRQGEFEQARVFCVEALEGQIEVLGKGHDLTFTSMHDLGVILRKQGKFVEAEHWSRSALNGRVKVVSVEHPSVLSSMTELAVALERLGKYREAETLARAALNGREKVLGAQHQSTLTSLNNLAAILRQRGNLLEAEEIARRALGGRASKLGNDHADTLTSASNLALTLQKQRRFQEAQVVNQDTLEIRERVLGPSHPATLTSMNNLAVSLRAQGKLEDAHGLLKSCLQRREKALGREHADTLTAESNLAWVLSLQGDFEHAEVLNRSVLQRREMVLGVQHPSTLASVYNTALGLRELGKLDEAEGMFRRALDGRLKTLGETHPTTIMTLNALENLQVSKQGGEQKDKNEGEGESVSSHSLRLSQDSP